MMRFFFQLGASQVLSLLNSVAALDVGGAEAKFIWGSQSREVGRW